jgi:ABC-type transport system involved in multi-copper enzyme maturation permease subunit
MRARVLQFARRELFDGFWSFRIPGSLVLILILFSSVTWTLSERYRDSYAEYQRRLQQNEAALKETQTYSALSVRVEKPPSPLNLLNKGVSERVVNSFTVRRVGYPELFATARSSDLLRIFPAFDLALVIQIVFGLLALVFSYAGVAGEKEQGTLRLVSSYAIPRWKLLMGKVLGNLAALEALLAVGFGLFLLIVRFVSGIPIGRDGWIRTGWLFLAASLYTTLIYLIGLFISTRSSRSSVALVASMFFWVVQVVLVPLTVDYYVAILKPMPPAPTFSASSRGYQLLESALKEVRKQSKNVSSAVNTSGPMAISGLDDNGRRFLQSRMREIANAQADDAKSLKDRIEARRRRLEDQEAVAVWIKLVSPAFVFDRLSCILAGTGEEGYRHFFHALVNYQRQISLWLKNEGAYDSPRYFDADLGPVSLDTLPRFDPATAVQWSEDLASSLPWIAGMAIACVVFFLLSFISFARFDVR